METTVFWYLIFLLLDLPLLGRRGGTALSSVNSGPLLGCLRELKTLF